MNYVSIVHFIFAESYEYIWNGTLFQRTFHVVVALNPNIVVVFVVLKLKQKYFISTYFREPII